MVFKILDFWLELGVDGLRLDAISAGRSARWEAMAPKRAALSGGMRRNRTGISTRSAAFRRGSIARVAAIPYAKARFPEEPSQERPCRAPALEARARERSESARPRALRSARNAERKRMDRPVPGPLAGAFGSW